MRTVKHPGPRAARRVEAVRCKAFALEIQLKAGLSVNEAIVRGLADAGCSAGYVWLQDIALTRLQYVIPAVSPDEEHIAWYSTTRTMEPGTIRRAGCMAGWRDGQAFVHCHGLWDSGDGPRMGHLLPFESVVAEDCKARAWGIDGAAMVARDDHETNFRLFAASAAPSTGSQMAGRRAVLASVRPNENLVDSIREVARLNDLDRPDIFGIGSLVGCRLAGGESLAWHANEALIVSGSWDLSRADEPQIEIALVDHSGQMVRGQLAPTGNAVSVTFELLLVGRQREPA